MKGAIPLILGSMTGDRKLEREVNPLEDLLVKSTVLTFKRWNSTAKVLEP